MTLGIRCREHFADIAVVVAIGIHVSCPTVESSMRDTIANGSADGTALLRDNCDIECLRSHTPFAIFDFKCDGMRAREAEGWQTWRVVVRIVARAYTAVVLTWRKIQNRGRRRAASKIVIQYQARRVHRYFGIHACADFSSGANFIPNANIADCAT